MLYNPTEQGQVGQLSNRYIVISRLIRYERLFISRNARLCHNLWHKIVARIALEHTSLPRTGKSRKDQRYTTSRNVIISTLREIK